MKVVVVVVMAMVTAETETETETAILVFEAGNLREQLGALDVDWLKD